MRPVIRMIRSRCSISESALTSCSPRLAMARQAERSGARLVGGMLFFPLYECQEVSRAGDAVIDLIHELVHEENPESPNLPLRQISRNVRDIHLGEIEGLSLIHECHDQTIVLAIALETEELIAATRICMFDDVGCRLV